LISVKVLNSTDWALFTDVIAGIEWVVDQANLAGSNRPVINMSLQADFVYTPLNDAVNNAVAAGVVVVVAGGNYRKNACETSPASAINAARQQRMTQKHPSPIMDHA
jgi:subtilisin family serine protease